ncbi:MAG: hypothetical protein H6618_07055 [Deltaproteobacteria bacterium]|nr:hypothetical protein [Deltaproteobacteria bacterium]
MDLNEFKSFPSILASIPGSSWCDTDQPVQFGMDGKRHVFGETVRQQRLTGHKKLNLMADDEQWILFLLSAAQQAGVEGVVNLVCGSPESTLLANQKILNRFSGKTFSLETPTGPKIIGFAAIWSVYEAIAHAYGIRTYLGLDEEMFVVSVGFGTIEGIILLKNGKPALETLIGDQRLGMRRAAMIFKNMLKHLSPREPDSGGSDAWYDSLLRDSYQQNTNSFLYGAGGEISLETRKQIADAALYEYAENILAPRLSEHMAAQVGNRITFCLTGGGSLYHPIAEVIASFAEKSGFHFRQADEKLALMSAAIGYSVLANSRDDLKGDTLVVDLGNCHTVCQVIRKH